MRERSRIVSRPAVAALVLGAASALLVASPAAAKPSCDGRTATVVVDDVEDLPQAGGAYQVRGTSKSDVVVIDLDRVDDHITLEVLFDAGKGYANGGDDAVCATTDSPGWFTTLDVVGGDLVQAAGWEVFRASDPTGVQTYYEVNATQIDIAAGGGDDDLWVTSSKGFCSCQQMVYIDAGSGDDWAYVNVVDNPKTAVTGVFGGAGDDSIFAHGNRADTLLVGGPGEDALQSANASLLAYGGTPTYQGKASGIATIRDQRTALNALLKLTTVQLNDLLAPNPASDGSENHLFGGAAADILHGAEGDDTISGGDGADRIRAYGGRDSLTGSTGDDRIEGGNGDDYLSGGDGADWLRGNDGADTLEGGAGNDDCSGGAGTDILKSCNP